MNRRPQFLSVKERKTRLHKLGGIQRHVRTLFRQYMDKNRSTTLNAVATQIGADRQSLSRFLAGTTTLVSEKSLKPLLDLLGKPELCAQVKSLAEGLSDRWIGLAALSPRALDLACEIHDQIESLEGRLTYESFAKLFGPHQGIVLGCLLCNLEKTSRFDEEFVGEQIRHVLAAKPWLTSGGAVNTELNVTPELSELRRVVRRLREVRFPSDHSLKRTLGVESRHFEKALQGGCEHATILRYLEKAKSLLLDADMSQPAELEDTAAGSERAPAADAPSQVAMAPEEAIGATARALDIRDLAGTESPLGVNYVLTSQSFLQLEAEYSEDIVRTAARTIEACRVMLNLITQFKDQETRNRVKHMLEPQIAELEIAMRMYDAAMPGLLTELYDSQRETWAEDIRNERPPYRGTRRK